jgi:hypothetical protein
MKSDWHLPTFAEFARQPYWTLAPIGGAVLRQCFGSSRRCDDVPMGSTSRWRNERIIKAAEGGVGVLSTLDARFVLQPVGHLPLVRTATLHFPKNIRSASISISAIGRVFRLKPLVTKAFNQICAHTFNSLFFALYLFRLSGEPTATFTFPFHLPRSSIHL